MFLSVPLPAIEEKQQKVHVVPADPSRPIVAYGAVVSKMGVINDLKKAVSALCGIAPRRLVFCEVWNHRIERIVSDDASVNEFREHDEVFAFEVPELEELKEGEFVIVPVLNQFLERNQYYDPQYPYMKPYYLTAAALPSLIVLPLKEPGISNVALYQRLAGIARQWLKPEFRVREHKDDGKSGPSGEEPEVPPASSAPASVPEAGAPGAPGGPPAAAPADPPAAAPPAAGGDNDNNGQQGEPGAPGETQKPPPPPPFLFRIVQLTAEGRDCRYHGYTSNCIGCPVDQDEKQFSITIQKNKQPHFSFGIQWAQNGIACDITRIRHEKHDSAGRVLSSKAESVSLAQCLSAFSKPETLAEADAWYCPTCKKHVCAEKKMDIYRLPDIFICHLKRFSYTREWREKLSSFVDFPILELKMGDYCANPEFKDAVYDLYGISNHMGGMGGGHYTAYVKNLNTGRWFEMDDSRAREVDPATIKSSAAYVLFYHKRGLAKHAVPEAGTPEPKRAAGDGEF
jgi:ubiquitin carboxyl-terminal hydrolase 4/11/15